MDSRTKIGVRVLIYTLTPEHYELHSNYIRYLILKFLSIYCLSNKPIYLQEDDQDDR
jgi:hypothetical protein